MFTRLMKTSLLLSTVASFPAFAEQDYNPWQYQLKKRPLTVNILHMNDHHSHVDADTFDLDISDVNLKARKADGTPIETVEVSYGGFPMMVSTFRHLEYKVKNPIKIHSGDAITGTIYYSLFEGESDAAVMNEICFDAFALGNHEFDKGDAGTAKFLDFLSNDGKCNTPVLAANVVPAVDSALRQKDYIQPYTIMTLEGQKVAMIGIDIADKTKNSSQPDAGTEFLDEAETAQKYIDELKAQGVNKIILVTHYGYQNDIELAAQLDGVDVIVGGDSHSLLGGDIYADLGFPVQGEYPTRVSDKSGNPVCVVQAWEYSHVMGRLKVRFDRNGKVKRCNGSPIMPVSYVLSYEDTDGYTKILHGKDKKKVKRKRLPSPAFKMIGADIETEALINDYSAQFEVLTQTVIGTVAEDLCLDRWPGQSRSVICDSSATYERGSDISNIVAKAFMSVTPRADIAIQNGGGVRVDVASGEYTIADAFSLLPFSNTLVTADMSGQEIVTMLEDALSNTLDDNGSSGSYPYASGLRYNVDASASEGSRISNVEVNPRVAGTWESIDLNATYTVVTNDFIASGRDGYDTFATVFAEGRFEDTFTEYAQGFIQYLQQLTANGETLGKLPVSEYSTQQYIGTDACNHSESADCSGY